MESAPQSSPARNSPCPCGSGEKYKRCCGRVAPAARAETAASAAIPAAGRKRSPWFWGISGLLVLTAGIFVTAMILGSREEVRTLTIDPAGETPAAWHYDPLLNRHWDPAHAHWHEGPPPTGIANGTPAPWHFDAVNNRHWDPAHNHWHEGPPPPEAQR